MIENANSFLFPMSIESENIASEFFKSIPELNANYGADAKGFVRVNMKSGMTKPVTFDMEKGLTLG